MKIRSGFVSNSSSSSFIISVPEGTKKVQFIIEEDVEKRFDNLTLDAEYRKEIFEFLNDDVKKKIEEEERKGNHILFGHVSDDCGDDPMAGFIHGEVLEKTLSKDVKLIKDCHGY